jgi:putative flavoprotein involved in K+ transport
MRTYLDTVIVGGGQAGLAVSYCLTRHGHAHIVLEQSDKTGEAWRNHRWDSFTLNTPNWQTKLPGAAYNGPDPDGFEPRSKLRKEITNGYRRSCFVQPSAHQRT